MKILCHSEFKVPTGFARVSQSIFARLKKAHEITVLDWYESTDSLFLGINIIGKQYKDDEFGINKLLQVYSQYDVIYILNDVWNTTKILAALKKQSGGVGLPKIIVYFPVDAELHNPKWYEHFDIVTHAVTYTKFAKEVVAAAVPALRDSIKIIPHGIDTDVFYKSPTPKEKIREKLWGSKRLNDAFIFISTNRNAPRKKLDITIRAFAEFLKKTGAKDAWLHLHCGMVDYGIPIPTIIKQFGVDHRIMVTSTEAQMQNISSEMLNLYYNAADVGLNASLGEGWGLCSIEGAVTGAPQIVPDHSACTELFGAGRGLLVDIASDIMLDGCYTMGKLPDYAHMAVCMESYYTAKKNNEELFNDGERAREYFNRSKFSWKVISTQWENLFNN